MNWKDIPGYEGIYMISDTGEVKSLSRKITIGYKKPLLKERILKSCLNDKGYKFVGLHKNGKLLSIPIHRLVACSFLSIEDGKKIVNHKNGIKTDNRLENLEWCDARHNVKHAFRLGLMKGTPLIYKKVIIEACSLGLKQSDIAKYFKLHHSTVYRIYSRSQQEIFDKTYNSNHL